MFFDAPESAIAVKFWGNIGRAGLQKSLLGCNLEKLSTLLHDFFFNSDFYPHCHLLSLFGSLTQYPFFVVCGDPIFVDLVSSHDVVSSDILLVALLGVFH